MNEKNTRFYYMLFVSIGVLVVVVFSSILFKQHDGTRELHTTKSDIQSAREEQQQARELTATVEQRLENSERIVTEIRTTNIETSKRIESVEERNATALELVRENRQLIDEGRRILESIRKEDEEARATE